MNDEVVVRLDGVRKAFGERRVLDGVSFEVRRGHAFCLLGRSGSGKSVTLRHIIGLVHPDEGQVLVNGRDVPRLSRRDLSEVRRGIGFLFQDAALFDSISVGENVAFPLRRHTRLPGAEIRDRTAARLAEVGLEREYDKMPAALSGGMRKRVGLARAMALDPAVLLVDEPSAGLDPVTSEEIDRLLLERKERAGVTLVVVTHNIPSARLLGDELAVLDQGRIVARGTAAELERSGNTLARAFMGAGGGG
ncbi:MAG TPA: ATP-binding cassette domain-containing protein [Vicinamibacterales bacterium]|nr:ATP-binding cassette domain-containing protein [Vicinamibacterales bacterium]